MPEEKSLPERVAALEAQKDSERREHDLIFKQMAEDRGTMTEAIKTMNSAIASFKGSVGYNKAAVAIIVAQTLIIGLLAGHAFP